MKKETKRLFTMIMAGFLALVIILSLILPAIA